MFMRPGKVSADIVCYNETDEDYRNITDFVVQHIDVLAGASTGDKPTSIIVSLLSSYVFK